MANVTRLFQNRRDADEPQVRSVPEPPGMCGVSGCDNPAHVLFAIARQNGREGCGSAGDFCNESWVNGKCHRSEKAGVEFVRWIARCEVCYQRDLDRTRTSRDDYLRGLPVSRT